MGYSCLNQNSKIDFDQKDNIHEEVMSTSLVIETLFPASELPSHTKMPAILL